MNSFSIWHWMVVLGFVVLPISVMIWGHCINRRNYPGQLKGFGGWLIIIAVGVWLAPLRNVGEIGQLLAASDKMPVAHLLDVSFVLSAILVIMQIVQIVMMTKRSWRFPSMFVGSSFYAIAIVPLSGLWMVGYLYTLYNVPVDVSANLYAREVGAEWIGGSIPLMIWMLYMVRSRRVKNTFCLGSL